MIQIHGGVMLASESPRVLSKWQNRHLLDAKKEASQSKDTSTKIGAVVVRSDNTVAGKGYNGLARGVNDEHIHDREFKYGAVIHAESNCMDSVRDPTLQDYTLFVWGLCSCGSCTARAINRGISHIICVQEKERPDWEVSFSYARTQAIESGITFEVFNLNEIDPRLKNIAFPDFSVPFLEW